MNQLTSAGIHSHFARLFLKQLVQVELHLINSLPVLLLNTINRKQIARLLKLRSFYDEKKIDLRPFWTKLGNDVPFCVLI